jgi:hypothetical protein
VFRRLFEVVMHGIWLALGTAHAPRALETAQKRCKGIYTCFERLVLHCCTARAQPVAQEFKRTLLVAQFSLFLTRNRRREDSQKTLLLIICFTTTSNVPHHTTDWSSTSVEVHQLSGHSCSKKTFNCQVKPNQPFILQAINTFNTFNSLPSTQERSSQLAVLLRMCSFRYCFRTYLSCR